MQRFALALRGARPSAPVDFLPFVRSRTALVALTLAGLAPGCVIVERHYYPVPGPAPAGAPDASGAPTATGTASAPQASGEATVPPADAGPAAQYQAAQQQAAQYPSAVTAQAGPPHLTGPSGAYDSQMPRFAFTVDGSLEVDDQENLWGFGLYVIPAESPLGFYLNTRFTAHSYGYPDFTYLFSYNAFDHQVVDEELHAFVFNLGAVAPVNEVLNLFAGIGWAFSETEVQLYDPARIYGDNGTYYQRINEDDEFNFNVGVLLTLDALALNAQYDTAFEVFSFGVGFAF